MESYFKNDRNFQYWSKQIRINSKQELSNKKKLPTFIRPITSYKLMKKRPQFNLVCHVLIIRAWMEKWARLPPVVDICSGHDAHRAVDSTGARRPAPAHNGLSDRRDQVHWELAHLPDPMINKIMRTIDYKSHRGVLFVGIFAVRIQYGCFD